MKKESGITLISLIIYIIALLIILTIATKLTSALYFNVQQVDKQSEAAVDVSKFNMYFLNDIKNKPAVATVSTSNQIDLSYLDGSEKITYSKSGRTLYRNKVKVLDNLDEMTITKSGETIQVYLKVGDYSKTTKYTIEQKPI